MTEFFDVEDLRTEVDSDPRRRARVDRLKREMEAIELAGLRRSQEVTQQELAETLNVTQANVSRIERGDDHYLSTLNDYVEALGGRLEIRAVFGERAVVIDAARQGAAGGRAAKRRRALPGRRRSGGAKPSAP